MRIEPLITYYKATKNLAYELDTNEIWDWLITKGYLPENYVLPPSFGVHKSPQRSDRTLVNKKESEAVTIGFPKTLLTNRTFSIMDPYYHHDIVNLLMDNWDSILERLFDDKNIVTSYSFPLPLSKNKSGRLGELRTGRLIYEFLDMTEDDLASVAYEFDCVLKTDIKNFYPSVYTHALSWAIHGKPVIRQSTKSRHDNKHWGNKLDTLLRKSNDGCSTGIPIGPVISDLCAEILLSAVDKEITQLVQQKELANEICISRFRDDYRILTKNDQTARAMIDIIQSAMRIFRLELNDDKTSIEKLPEGIFRKWQSAYFALLPEKKDNYSWKEFRELYLKVLAIKEEFPSSGVIDRFLVDISSEDGKPRIKMSHDGGLRIISMLFMLGNRSKKSFTKILAMIETMYDNIWYASIQTQIANYCSSFLLKQWQNIQANKHSIVWLIYFMQSKNMPLPDLPGEPTDPLIKSLLMEKNHLFNNRKEFGLFKKPSVIDKEITLSNHLNVFGPHEKEFEAPFDPMNANTIGFEESPTKEQDDSDNLIDDF